MNVLKSLLVSFLLLINVISSNSFANIYEFSFYANPNSSDNYVENQNDPYDINYKIRFDLSKFEAANLFELNLTKHWVMNDITLQMNYQDKSVYLNDAIDPNAMFLSIKPEQDFYNLPGGFVEIYSMKSDFFDIDLHPWSSFVISNQLPLDPFVYGRLDIYDNQQSFSDLYSFWVEGDKEALSKYSVSSVDEPNGLILLGFSLFFLILFRKKYIFN